MNRKLIAKVGWVCGMILPLLVLGSEGSCRTSWSWMQSPRHGWLGKGRVDSEGVRQALELSYYSGPDADPVKHKLDLYLPEGKTGFPVVIFIHGGGWVQGDKRWVTDPYGDLGRTFARNGVGVACVNYRLSPQFQYPVPVQDVARAFAWVRRNIAGYGGDADRMFVMGHSAGGHLAALLSTDERWLKEQGLSLENIRGAIPISGGYDLATLPNCLAAKPFEFIINRFAGRDPERIKQASPINYLDPGKSLPPFLVIWGGRDLPLLPDQAEAFAKKLKDNGHQVKAVRYASSNHLATATGLRKSGGPELEEVLKFIRTY